MKMNKKATIISITAIVVVLCVIIGAAFSAISLGGTKTVSSGSSDETDTASTDTVPVVTELVDTDNDGQIMTNESIDGSSDTLSFTKVEDVEGVIVLQISVADQGLIIGNIGTIYRAVDSENGVDTYIYMSSDPMSVTIQISDETYIYREKASEIVSEEEKEDSDETDEDVDTTDDETADVEDDEDTEIYFDDLSKGDIILAWVDEDYNASQIMVFIN